MMGNLHNRQVAIYTPESSLRRPWSFLANFAADLRKAWPLAWRLFVRDTSAKYRQSILGFAWMFLPPVAMAIIFSMLSRSKILNAGDVGIPYPLYVLCGTVLWGAFVEAVNAPLRVFTQASGYLGKINFPRESMVLAAGMESMVNSIIRLLIVVPVILYYGQTPALTGLLAVPIALLGLVVLGMLIGILATPVGLLFQDVQKALPLVLQVWFFATPVVYNLPPGPRLFANPVATVLVTGRDLLTLGEWPFPGAFALVLAVGTLGLIVVWLLTRLAMPHLLERMTA